MIFSSQKKKKQNKNVSQLWFPGSNSLTLMFKATAPPCTTKTFVQTLDVVYIAYSCDRPLRLRTGV